jgi:DNA-binding transcriptional ArsR family regulator
MPHRMAQGIELLADPTRRRIVALIAARVWHPAEMAIALKLSRSAVSRQLRILLLAGLVEWTHSEFDGRSRVYLLHPRMQGPILAWLAGVDLHEARPRIRPVCSPPMRVFRLRHHARVLPVEWDS